MTLRVIGETIKTNRLPLVIIAAALAAAAVKLSASYLGADFFVSARARARSAESAVKGVASELLGDGSAVRLTDSERADIAEISARTARTPGAREALLAAGGRVVRRSRDMSDSVEPDVDAGANLPRAVSAQSPYFVPAAEALREFRAKEKAFGQLTGEDEDVRRQATYELSRLREKVVELNRKHREWKERNGVKAAPAR